MTPPKPKFASCEANLILPTRKYEWATSLKAVAEIAPPFIHITVKKVPNLVTIILQVMCFQLKIHVRIKNNLIMSL